MRAKFYFVILFALLTSVAAVGEQGPLTAFEAIDHVGERATVCGKVVSATYASSSRGQPTFINLDRAYPDHVFTIVIWGQNRSKFGKPENEYRAKRVCVTGTIETYRGKAQIVATTPSQIDASKTDISDEWR